MDKDRKRIEKMASGFMPARILLTACELDLFTCLGSESLSAGQIAERCSCSPEPMRRLLNALTALGLLSKQGEKYSNTRATKRMLVRGRPGYLGDIMLHRQNLWERWGQLTRIVKTGKVPSKKRTAERERRFIQGMANLGYYSALQTARALSSELRGAERLLDVGGGPAVYACVFARKYPELRITVLDLPGPLRYARRTVRAEGLTGRVRLKSCDAVKARTLGRNYDFVFMSNFIHSFKAPVASMLVRKAGEALKPGGILAIKDFYINPAGTRPVFAALFSVNMLVANAGDCYSRSRVSEWMRQAGVRPVRYTTVGEHSGILIGRKT